MESVLMSEVISESNRKYTKDDSFEQLLLSVREYGIIEPPVVRRLAEGGFRVLAGRRRVEAARRLNYDRIDCIVREPEDPVKDGDIALCENVNRMDMHPLDEAAAFKRMADEGGSIEEIARYYARSPSAIYKRLRLAGLIEELRGLFRDGALHIAGAVVLAELPEEDQQKFYEQWKYAAVIDSHAITRFVQQHQRFRIRACMGDGCQACGERTHNSGNDLFEEFAHLSDVCLDGDCYRAKWHALINEALAETIREAGLGTELKIHFRSAWSNGIPELLYKNARYVEFTAGQEEAIRFEVLQGKAYEFTGKTTRKKDACWIIGETFDGISVTREGYKRIAPRVPDGKDDAAARRVDCYGREVLEYIAAEQEIPVEELALALESNHVSEYDFHRKIKVQVYERVTAEKLKEERPRDYLAMCMRYLDENIYDFNQKRFTEVTGKKSLKEFCISDELQKLFHFLLLGFDFASTVPDIAEIADIAKRKDHILFFDYAGLDAEGYRKLYLDTAREVAAGVLRPAAKRAAPSSSAKKRGRPAKKQAAEAAEAEAPEENAAPSPSVKRRGRPAKKQAAEAAEAKAPGEKRRCRICGCTDEDCSQCIAKTGAPCYWVEEDLCSACAAETGDAALADDEDEEADDYPFSPDFAEDDPEIAVAAQTEDAY